MNTESLDIQIKKLHADALLPRYGTSFSAGADLYACMESPVMINPGQTCLIHTGIALQIPEGYAGFIFARSGLSSRQGLAPANKVGVIDSDYRGEIMVSLYNHSDRQGIVEPGDRIAQIVFMPYKKARWLLCEELDDTERGSGGFGSTGMNQG